MRKEDAFELAALAKKTRARKASKVTPPTFTPCGLGELRLGDWREVLADVTECDVLCFDAPYSERTHAGQRTGSSIRSPTIAYDALTPEHAKIIAIDWYRRTMRWAIAFGDHASYLMHEQAWADRDWYTFAPVPWVKHPAPPRMAGDGPACSAEYIMVARPKKRIPSNRAGSRPGDYRVKGRCSCDAPAGIAGQKDLGGMRALIRDYTLPGDLVIDPFAGSGTTILACAIEGRRCIGAEISESTFALASKRLRAGYTPGLFREATG